MTTRSIKKIAYLDWLVGFSRFDKPIIPPLETFCFSCITKIMGICSCPCQHGSDEMHQGFIAQGGP